MKKKALTLAAALVLLTGCSNPLDKDGGTETVTTAPVTTTEAPTDPPTTLPKKVIYFRMGEDETTEPFLTSEHISTCSLEFPKDENGETMYTVSMLFDEEGTDIFAKKTEEAANSGTPITIWYNEYLLTINSVSEPITDGNAAITGLDFDSAAKVSSWIYECIEKPEETTANEGEQ